VGLNPDWYWIAVDSFNGEVARITGAEIKEALTKRFEQTAAEAKRPM
jgi:hypothetical protein